MNSSHSCSKCYKLIPLGTEMEAFGILWCKRCAPKNARPVKVRKSPR